MGRNQYIGSEGRIGCIALLELGKTCWKARNLTTDYADYTDVPEPRTLNSVFRLRLLPNYIRDIRGKKSVFFQLRREASG
jgi:hypothetical protein